MEQSFLESPPDTHPSESEIAAIETINSGQNFALFLQKLFSFSFGGFGSDGRERGAFQHNNI